uniref:Uncharacterized protein n=1 Tax=Tanacetum cinerariifolium TaxID=118510 RepID=A0A6L2LTU0_TANCI|nr:hypothetical protein [Tanacetum cinerariifolium]
MSNTNNSMQTQTSNTLHNAIMEAGGKDRLPMLAPGNYVQWKSKIKRYVDTKPNHELIHHCLKNPPYKYQWADKDVPVTEGIDNDIDTTVDACLNACEMWKSIERLKQGESINVQDLETNLYWEFRKFTSRDGESLESYYSRANQDNSLRINRGTGYDNQRIGNVAGARENVGTTMDDPDDEFEDQELEAHYMYMAQIQEVNPDVADDSGPIFDTEPLQKVEIDCAKAKGDLMSYKMESEKSFNVYTRKINDLNQTILEMKKELFTHQETISLLLQAKEAQLKFYKTREDKEIDKVIALENKVKVLDNIVYKNSQTVQTINMLNRNCKTSFAKPEFLKKAQKANSRLYDIGCYNDNLALMLAPEYDEVIRLEKKKNQSKEFCKEREQYFEIRDLKAQLQDKGIAISELKKLIEKLKGKSMETKFEKLSVIRQPNAFKSQRPSILGKPTIFSDSHEKKDCSKSKSVTKNNVSNDFFKPVTAQILPLNKKSILKNINVLAPGMYKLHTEPTQTRTTQLPHDFRRTNKRVSFSTGVICTNSVSRPQLKSNQIEERVMLKNSQRKKYKLEDHRRNVKFSKNKTYHDMCVLHSLNGVNSRTKMPMAVPISTREPKRIIKQSVAKPLRRTVVSESTNQKPKNTTRKLYEHVTKTCSWWYPKFTPPGYKWKPTSQIGNVNPYLLEIILFIVDSGCSKHMMGNLKLLTNFVEKFLGSVKFGNDQIAPIFGYGDLVQGTVTIKRVYYIEELNQNLFSVGHFCDANLEVAFRKSTYYIHYLKGNDLLTGSRGIYLYSVTLQDITSFNPIFLMAKSTSSQAWLWHRRLSYLNFDTINLLSKNDIVIGLPMLKFVKDYLCSSCELGKAKRKSFQTKNTSRSKRWLQLLHMDLCGPMRVESINGRKYVLVIIDYYSRYTWTYFLRSKDETPEVLVNFLRLVQRGLHAQGDACIFVGYYTQSRAYRVFNKRTRVIVETIHVNFDELPLMASDHVTGIVTASNELDLLFSPMFNELLNGSTQGVSKSSIVTTANAPNQCQQQHTTPLNTQTTPESTCQVPTQTPTIMSTENINQAEIITENAQVEDDEFINIFSTSVQDQRETSSRHIDSSNMHTFYQRHPYEHRWTKDHPLEQVIGNPS